MCVTNNIDTTITTITIIYFFSLKKQKKRKNKSVLKGKEIVYEIYS
jgi:hypothetical protein